MCNVFTFTKFNIFIQLTKNVFNSCIIKFLSLHNFSDYVLFRRHQPTLGIPVYTQY